jgi:hypothetical protein
MAGGGASYRPDIQRLVITGEYGFPVSLATARQYSRGFSLAVCKARAKGLDSFTG